MNRAGKITLGCLLAPIGLGVILVVFLSAVRMAGVPEPQITQKTMEQELPERPERGSTVLEAPHQTSPERSSTALPEPGTEPVQVVIDLDEGYFKILPGPADEGIRVDADYDEAGYDLTQDYRMDREGHPTYVLRLKSKVSFLRRLAHDGGMNDEDLVNDVRVHLPVDTPMKLFLSLSKSESEIDLTGLSLTSVVARLRMGEYRLNVNEPNPIEMTDFRFNGGMGEVRMEGLSRLGAQSVQIDASMGEVLADFESDLQRDTDVRAHMKMGELTLRLPENAVWDPSGSLKATIGEVQGSLENPGSPDPELGPVLRANGAVFLGGIIVDSFRSRGLREGRSRH